VVLVQLAVWVVWLKADEIRRVFASGVDRFPPTAALEIHWERATKETDAGDRVPETRPRLGRTSRNRDLDKATERNVTRSDCTR